MALGSRGTLFIGTRTKGKVYAVLDKDKNHVAEEVITIARGLFMPNGIAYREGSLYVAEVNRILKYNQIENNLHNPGKPDVIKDDLPSDEHHGWKYIGFDPIGKLFIPIGAPCNICEPGRPYAAIHRMNPDGTEFEQFAQGVRNTVGFDWHPTTGDFWFTDNGRDWLGDDLPPDELNHAPRQNMHFGYPYWHGKDIPDPKFGKKPKKIQLTPPALELGPHVAALGMRFYTGNMFPKKYKNQLFIAEHGSWNRSTPIGYRITSVSIEDNKASHYKISAEGWLQGGREWGRPVDVLIMPDGAMLISDDKVGAIYRITFNTL